MSFRTFLRGFVVEGVFWRKFLRWGVLNAPLWLEPVILSVWSFLFLAWAPGRRGVMGNLAAILPGSWAVTNFWRTYLVFWNFAWTIADTVRFKELRVIPDWEFAGVEHFEALTRGGGAIILTAHMGNYDLGAHLFAEESNRRIVMVRAPENDPRTREYEEALHGRTAASSRLRVDFSTRASDLALDLIHALQRGEIIAIQGDRVTPGITVLPATLFGKSIEIPAGPFALSMAARVPIYPLFIVRLGRRRYRLIVSEPFDVVRTRDRAEAFDRAARVWTAELERVVRRGWFQWFTFQPFSKELS